MLVVINQPGVVTHPLAADLTRKDAFKLVLMLIRNAWAYSIQGLYVGKHCMKLTGAGHCILPAGHQGCCRLTDGTIVVTGPGDVGGGAGEVSVVYETVSSTSGNVAAGGVTSEHHVGADLERMRAQQLTEAQEMVRTLTPYAAHLLACRMRACFGKGLACTCGLQEALDRAAALVPTATASAERELLTCSQCGAQAQAREGVQPYVVCTNESCAFRGPRRSARALAVKAWNHINRVV